tara:strand:+ start:291 stop:1025 length:735 start_codon:yes stop_codon:yes gene_type:complete
MNIKNYFSNQAKVAILGYLILSVAYFIRDANEKKQTFQKKVLNYLLLLIPFILSIIMVNCLVVGVRQGGIPCNILAWLYSVSILILSLLFLVIVVRYKNIEKYTECSENDKLCLAFKKCDEDHQYSSLGKKLECYKKIVRDNENNNNEEDDVSRVKVDKIDEGHSCNLLKEKSVNCTDKSGKNNIECCGEGAYANLKEIKEAGVRFGVIDDPAFNFDNVHPAEVPLQDNMDPLGYGSFQKLPNL